MDGMTHKIYFRSIRDNETHEFGSPGTLPIDKYSFACNLAEVSLVFEIGQQVLYHALC